VVSRCLDSVRALAEAGATWLFASPPNPSRNASLEYVNWFGEEIIARSG
jgi:hypothetical protein